MSNEDLIQKYMIQALGAYRLQPAIVNQVRKAMQNLLAEVGGSGSAKKPKVEPAPKTEPKPKPKAKSKTRSNGPPPAPDEILKKIQDAVRGD